MQMTRQLWEDVTGVMALGSSYWAGWAEDWYEGPEDFGIRLYELDEMGTPIGIHEVLAEDILQVLDRLDREGSSAYNVSIGILDALRQHKEEDFMVHVDAEAADCWLQLAVFGELVFA